MSNDSTELSIVVINPYDMNRIIEMNYGLSVADRSLKELKEAKAGLTYNILGIAFYCSDYIPRGQIFKMPIEEFNFAILSEKNIEDKIKETINRESEAEQRKQYLNSISGQVFS